MPIRGNPDVERLARIEATSVSALATTNQMYGRPVSELTRSPIETPIVRASAIITTMAPRRAPAPAIGRSRGTTASPPNANLAETAAPTASPSPVYNRAFPATPMGEGAGVVTVGAPGAATTSPGLAPTPNAKTFAVGWPSAAETTRQETVYTPSARSSGIETVRERGASPSSTGPIGTAAPVPSSIVTHDR